MTSSEIVLDSLKHMSHTIPAIYENGIIRPLEEIELANGEEVEVFLIAKSQTSPDKSRQIISEIADLPIQGDANTFSGVDHDEILYPKE